MASFVYHELRRPTYGVLEEDDEAVHCSAISVVCHPILVWVYNKVIRFFTWICNQVVTFCLVWVYIDLITVCLIYYYCISSLSIYMWIYSGVMPISLGEMYF